MEDRFSIMSTTIDGQTVGLFGVFDGHGGSRAAEYLKKHLFENLVKHPKFLKDTKLAISNVLPHHFGCTAVSTARESNRNNEEHRRKQRTAIAEGAAWYYEFKVARDTRSPDPTGSALRRLRRRPVPSRVLLSDRTAIYLRHHTCIASWRSSGYN
uniref:protein-serine/threonine phosphatase n=1 Tax=Oryza brachyantha TaxID=4533 RepID=J3MEM9_ORYBR